MNKVNIYGGLGNQMFQYAMAIGLKERGIDSRVSFRDFFLYNHHNGYELPLAFQIQMGKEERLKYWLLTKLTFLWNTKFVKKAVYIYFKFFTTVFERCVLEKEQFKFDDSVFGIRDSRLIGTWQSVDYFLGYEPKLREKFKFREPSDQFNVRLAEQIRDCNSVAVHIRRGDYTNSEWRNSHMVFKNLTYYKRSIELFSKRFSNPVFYFFSDDMDWVKENFNSENFRFVDHNRESSSYIDMYLMSLCSGFIIANSTFSWWAAWLSERQNKQVIIPNTWINGMQTPGIYPDGWNIEMV
tara:strand:- start:1226 stop:2113 length:888 start_codon:yes stop_codon:yes gene_type:complete